jgi:hypothetical protein
LQLYTEELKDFIEEKRKRQAELQQQREQEKQTLLSVGGYPGASSILFSYADVMKVGGNIFCTQKIISNNSNLKPMGLETASSSAPPKLQTDKPVSEENRDDDEEFNEDLSPEELAAAEAEKAEKLK